MKKKIITILSTSVILSTFISALTLNANTELSSQNSCKDFQKFVLTKGYDYNYKYDLNSNGTINVLDLCRQKKYELIKNNITTTTTPKVTTTTSITTTPITTVTTTKTTTTTTTPVTTTTKPQTTTTVVTTAPPVTTTVQTTPVDTSNWNLTISEIQEIAKMVNDIRNKNGVASLEVDLRLCNVANARADEVSRGYINQRPDGSAYRTIFDEYGLNYSIRGEITGNNISSKEVFISKIATFYILNRDVYTHIGIGKKGNNWALLFGCR